MNRFVLILLAGLGALLACQRDDSSLRARLDSMQVDLAEIKKLVASGGGRGAGMPQQREAPGRPNPNDVFAVSVEGAPSVGPRDAKITIVKVFEFACPFCERARPTMDQLLKDYPNDVRIVYRHFVVHPQVATIPAQAACAAGMQGKFHEMYDGIWDKGFSANRDLSRENMEKIAKDVGLDFAKFKSDLDGPCTQLVRKDQADLGRVGVTGTPAFYINGRMISGARPVEQFKAVVDEELKKANDRIAKGEASASDYYDKFVVQRGKKQFAP